MNLARIGKRNWHAVAPFRFTNSKFARILEICRGKDVLDCGCVGSPIENAEEMAGTSHFQIAAVSRRCVGVDLNGTEIGKRRSLGYDVRHANVESMALGEQFDVVVAGDLIEHVSNAGAFLEAVKDHLRPAGLLCLVTPNATSANSVFKAIFGVESIVNPEHTCWYDPITLQQLLTRHGFEPLEYYWQDYQRHPLVTILTRLRPNLSAHFILIARLQGGSA